MRIQNLFFDDAKTIREATLIVWNRYRVGSRFGVLRFNAQVLRVLGKKHEGETLNRARRKLRQNHIINYISIGGVITKLQ